MSLPSKIILVGSGGAGKSTLARRLGEASGFPVHHLDALFWKSGWVETPGEEWAARQREICAGPAWVIDGNYGGTLPLRLEAADTIVFLDYPRALCLFRVLKRTLSHLGRVRADMAPGCPERLFTRDYLVFLKWIWNYPERNRPGLLAKLDKLREQKRIVILRCDRDTAAFLAAMTEVFRQPGKSGSPVRS